MLNRSKHSLTVKPDIRGYRYANVRKATCSRLTNVNTRMTAKADDATAVIHARMSVDWAESTFERPCESVGQRP